MVKKALLSLVGLVVALVGVAGVVAYALFFPSPREPCPLVVRQAWPGADTAGLYHPMGLAWSGGMLYVADTEHGTVKRFQANGALVSTWVGFERPVAVAPVGRIVYVADFLTDRITVLDGRGRIVRQWGRHGGRPGEFDAPSGIAVDRQGNVYVADFYNHRVQKFTGDGRFLLQWGSKGRGKGRFRYPTGVAVMPTGEVVVADGFNHRVQRFTVGGRYIDRFGGTGFGIPGKWPGWFALAKDVAVDAAGTVYVADAFNGRVQTFTRDGQLLAIWVDRQSGEHAPAYVSGVAVEPQGRAYVSNFSQSTIFEIACPTGERRQTGGSR